MARHNNKYLDKGFIKLGRHMLTMPDMAKMYECEGAVGLGIYFAINFHLNNSADHWMIYSRRQLTLLAQETHRRAIEVKRIIGNYNLFVVKDGRFTSFWMKEQYSMDADSEPQTCDTRTRTYNTHAEDIDKDVKKENKEKGIVRVSDDTHQPSSDSPPPTPSDEEEDSTTNYNKFNHYFKR